MNHILPIFRRFCLTVVAIVTAWLFGFFLFLVTLPAQPSDMMQSTDAIVVLTGGKGRVELGFSLFEAGLGKRLFISGVHPGVKAHTLASKQKIPTHLTQRLYKAELEYGAQNTAQNAIETAKWAKVNSIQSIRLVTGDYHVQRSLIEFKKLLPDVCVIAHPVSKQRRLSLKSLSLLWSEYIKLTFVWVKYKLR